MTAAPRYPLHRPASSVPASPDLPALEKDVLAFWEEDGTFQASIDAREAGEHGSNEYVFYDGPPFANGLPHYGHLLTGYAKDVVPRYQTMRGHRVERRFGWDTHGLPAELEAQRLLGITDTSQIEEMGLAAFNQACRESVLRYTGEWREYVTRQARWVDFDHDYKTLDVTFMESVIWAFKRLYDQDMAYEGYRVLPYCWRDETPLSNHELRMDDDVYQSRQDPALTVGLRAGDRRAGPHLDDDPVDAAEQPRDRSRAGRRLRHRGAGAGKPSARASCVVLAAARLGAYAKELGEATVVATVKGRDLAGRRYTPPFDYFAGRENAHQVLLGDFVTTEDGSGIVHMAPAFGEDDMVACEAVGIAPVVPVDSQGKFTTEVPDYVGQLVFDANKPIIADLKAGTGPLARVADDQRSVAGAPRDVRALLPALLALPEPADLQGGDQLVRARERLPRPHGRAQPGHRLDAGAHQGRPVRQVARRTRATGRSAATATGARPSPCGCRTTRRTRASTCTARWPSWRRDFGRVPTNEAGEPDLHRPFIDELTRPNPDDPTGALDDAPDPGRAGRVVRLRARCRSRRCTTRSRTPTGSSTTTRATSSSSTSARPAAGSTRCTCWPRRCSTARRSATSCATASCWATTAARPASRCATSPTRRRCGTVYGSDAVRWFLMSSSILRGGNLIVGEEGIRDGVRQVLLPLWSTYYFFSLYAGAADGGAGLRREAGRRRTCRRRSRRWTGTSWRARATWWRATTEQLDAYDISAACETRARAPRRPDQLVRAHAARPVLGRGRRRLRHALDRARGAHARHGAARAAGHRGGLARADRRSQRAPDRLADGAGPAAPRRRRARRRDGPGPRRGRRRRSACARPRACACGSRCATLTVAVADADALAPYTRPARGRAQRQARSTWSRPTPAPRSASASRSASRSTPARPARGWVAGCRRSSRPHVPGPGASDGGHGRGHHRRRRRARSSRASTS